MLVEGLAVDLASRVEGLASPGQVLMTQAVFDAVRQRLKGVEFEREVAWRAHGAYLLKGIDDPIEIGEAGFEGISPLAAPPDSEKARRAVAAGDEVTLGWRPAVGLAIPGRAHWRLQEQLGTGAIGEVWLAAAREHPRAPRVQVLLPGGVAAQPQARGRAAAAVEGEPGRAAGYRPGDRLAVRRAALLLRDGALGGGKPRRLESAAGRHREGPPRDASRHRRAIADALAAAHRAGVLHKDLKPANVLIYEDEEGRPHVCLTDFGIGLVTSREALEAPGVTVAGLTEALLSSGTSTGAGTRLYMAPEVTEGHQATPLSDVYSLGVILYQIVAGDFGHALATGWERDVEEPLLREDVAACVDGDPAKRLSGPEELARRLRALPERRAKVRTARSRRRRLIGAGAAAALALLAVGGWRGFQLWSKARWARDTAVPEIIRLAQAGDFPPAFALATEVERQLGADPRLEPMWQGISTSVSLVTEPPGATVSYKPYADVEGEWTTLGSLPDRAGACTPRCVAMANREAGLRAARARLPGPLHLRRDPLWNGRRASHWTQRGRRPKGWSRWRAVASPPCRSPAFPQCRPSTWSASTSAARR